MWQVEPVPIATATASPDEPDDGFDPSWIPDKITVEWFRQMPVRRLLVIERHLDELTPEQRRQWHEASRTALGPAIDAAAQVLSGDVTAKLRAVSAAMPKIKPILDPEVMRVIRRNTAALDAQFRTARLLADMQVDIPKLDLPQIDLDRPAAPTDEPSSQSAEDGGALGVDEEASITAVESTEEAQSGAQLAADLVGTTEQLELLARLVDNIEQQRNRSEDERLLAALIAFAAIVQGVSGIANANSAGQGAATFLISLALWGLAFLAYRRSRKRRS